LRSNQITKIENLDKLPILDWLDLSSNQITKIENLNKFPILNSLDLSDNQITKIENLNQLVKSLVNYPSFKLIVDLENNPIKPIEINKLTYLLPNIKFMQ